MWCFIIKDLNLNVGVGRERVYGVVVEVDGFGGGCDVVGQQYGPAGTGDFRQPHPVVPHQLQGPAGVPGRGEQDGQEHGVQSRL